MSVQYILNNHGFMDTVDRTMPAVRRHRNVPDAIRSKSPLEPDYVDLFTVAAASARRRSAEQWARAGIEEAAGLGGQFVWRMLLHLRLAPRSSPDHVGGWKIAARRDRWVRLEAASWFLTAHLVVCVDADRVSVATFIRYDRRVAALVWPPLSIGHRHAMPGLLRHAAKSAVADAA